jgi:hypothetical protein
MILPVRFLPARVTVPQWEASEKGGQSVLFSASVAAPIGQSIPMTPIEKLGQRLLLAQSAGVPAELLALVLITSHPGRLQALFQQVSGRLLAAHQSVQQRPGSAAAVAQRGRNKALLDLVRARIAAIGSRKPPVEKMLVLMDARPPVNVINLRKAA